MNVLNYTRVNLENSRISCNLSDLILVESLLINLLYFWKIDLLVLFYKNTTMKSILYLLSSVCVLNPLNDELNSICHLLAFLGAHHILHISRIRVKYII